MICCKKTLYNNIALPVGYLSHLDEPKFVETLIQCFVGQTRAKKIERQQNKRGKNEKPTSF